MLIQSFNNLLQANNAVIQGLGRLATQGILTTDAQLNISSWNHWLEIHSGLGAQQVIGRNLLEVYPELIERRLDRFYQQALNGQVVVLAQRLHSYLLPMSPSIGTCQSSQMLQSVRIGPLMADSCCIGTITVIDDVTERVEREAELKHQIEALQQTKSALLSTHTQLQHLLASSPAVLYTRKSSGDGGISFVSDNVSEKLGYQPHEFIENPRFWSQQIHPDDTKQLFAIALHLFHHQYHVLEYRFRHKDGTYRWIRDEMKLVYNQQGSLQEIVGAWYDITENKQAQEQVKEQAALLDITTDAILVQDFKNKILFWNKSAERLYGWKTSDVQGKNALNLLYQETEQLEPIWKALDEKGAWQGELRQITKDGKAIIVESSWTVVRETKENPKSILIVNTDITQKKQLEAQFLRIQRLESIGTLASGIAHDLNNILAPMLISAQVLETRLQDEKSKKLLQILITNAKRGANLVKQVLSFGRGIEGQFTTIQVKHLISDFRQIVTQTFPKSIELSLDVSPDLWTVSGDATQLHQVLMNLCVNARDVMPQGGLLTICAENVYLDQTQTQVNIDAKVGPYIAITVADTGTGIPSDLLDRIFEPFFTTKEIGKGTGLGLPTVLGIIKGHGGFLNVSSEVGKGTEFKIYLPGIQEDEIERREEIQFPTGNGEQILIVDDEVFIRELSQVTLKKYGYRVLTASNGIEAVDLYAQHQDEISLVLLDMMMPSMDGPSTVHYLQKINPSIKIIAMSGLALNVMLAEVAKLGVTTFLSKPYTQEELLEAISQTLQIGNRELGIGNWE